MLNLRDDHSILVCRVKREDHLVLVDDVPD